MPESEIGVVLHQRLRRRLKYHFLEDEPLSRSLNNVAIVANAIFRDLQISLAQRLQSRHGSQIHLYVRGHLSVAYFEKNAPGDLFATISVNPNAHPLKFPNNLDAARIEQKARQFEERYGRSFNSFAVDDRHFGRGYAPGGYHHPRSRQSETSSYVQFLNAYIEFFEYWENEFEQKELDIIIDGGLREEAVARAHGAISRRPTSAKLENRWYWTTDRYGFSEIFAEQYGRQGDVDDIAIAAQMPFVQMAVNRQVQQHQRFTGMVKRGLNQIKHHAYYHYKKSEKAKRYYLSSELMNIYREWRDFRYVSKHHKIRLADLEGRRFAYYPLHVEPELALQSRSPEYFYQLSAIISIARELPAGVVLAVKEHIPAIGRRPDRFYEQISELKNVVFMDAHENGLDIVCQADIVVAITGTAGQEAAVRGVPVISFGRHNMFNIMPHVFIVTDEGQIAGYIKAALDVDFDRAAAQAEGRRFVAAMRDISFDMETMNHINTGRFSDAAVEEAYRQLMRSMGMDEIVEDSQAANA